MKKTLIKILGVLLTGFILTGGIYILSIVRHRKI